MSKKHLEAINARADAVNALGRMLVRRAKSRCELCGSQEGRLRGVEVTPLVDEPLLEETVMACQSCIDVIGGGAMAGRAWRFLEETVWSEVVPVQVLATRLLQRLASQGEAWATATLENLYLAPDIQARVEGS